MFLSGRWYRPVYMDAQRFLKSGANMPTFLAVLLVKTTKLAYGGAFFAKILRIRSSERSKSCAKAA